jgi:hypothetical protein
VPTLTAEQQVVDFIDKYTPAIAEQFLAAIGKMRKRLPGAVALVYDNYNGLVIGFGPTERPSEALFSILAQPDHITLCFLQGVRLKDPKGVLSGGGKQVRHVLLEDGRSLDDPEIVALMKQAIGDDHRMVDPAIKRSMIIRAVAKKQRPRRPH